MKGHLLGPRGKVFLRIPKRDVTCLTLESQQPRWGCEGPNLRNKADKLEMAEGKGIGTWIL